MNYIAIAGELGIDAETDGDGSVFSEMRWNRKPTQAEISAAWTAIQNRESNVNIIAQIEAIDIKRIRPLAEGDTAYLATLNKQIIALRAKLK